MTKRLLAFLMTLVLLPVSLFAAAEEGAEADAEVVKGPVAKTMDDLNAMLDGGQLPKHAGYGKCGLGDHGGRGGRNHQKADGRGRARVLTGRTHQTLLPISGFEQTYYAWVVYTDNPWQKTDVGYVAHYLNENGEYILSIPVSEPWSSDSMSGAGTEFVFEGLEESRWTGDVALFDGRRETITVPTMTDPGTGDVFLGDLRRRIVCADYTDFKSSETVTMIKQEDGRFDDGDLLTLMNMIPLF